MRTLNFKIQPTVTLFIMPSITAAHLLETKTFGSNGVKRSCSCTVIGNPLCRFLYFCGQSVVAVIMIDGSKNKQIVSWVMKFKDRILLKGLGSIHFITIQELFVMNSSSKINAISKDNFCHLKSML